MPHKLLSHTNIYAFTRKVCTVRMAQTVRNQIRSQRERRNQSVSVQLTAHRDIKLTFEAVLDMFQSYLKEDLEEEVLPCRRGYVRVTWNGDDRDCVDGILCRTPEELFDLLLEDCLGYEEIRRTKGRGELDEKEQAELDEIRRSYLAQRREEAT